MGKPDIKYDDSIVFLQHCDTGLWLSYQTFETKKRGVGRVEEKKVSRSVKLKPYVIMIIMAGFLNHGAALYS